jgi:hypothetical protein
MNVVVMVSSLLCKEVSIAPLLINETNSLYTRTKVVCDINELGKTVVHRAWLI